MGMVIFIMLRRCLLLKEGDFCHVKNELKKWPISLSFNRQKYSFTVYKSHFHSIFRLLANCQSIVKKVSKCKIPQQNALIYV